MQISPNQQIISEQYTTTAATEDLNQKKSSTIDLKVNPTSLSDTAVKLDISTEGLSMSRNLNLANHNDFKNEIVQIQNTNQKINLPEYSGIESTDKAIAKAIENCSSEEKSFVYGIIRDNFLISDLNNITEQERQSNITLGMEKAKNAADNFISKENKQNFLEAMKTIANLALKGKVTSEGKMDYGIYKGSYLGSGSNLVRVDNEVELLKRYDKNSYKTYKNLKQETDAFKYILNSTKNYYEIAEKDNQQYLKENKII